MRVLKKRSLNIMGNVKVIENLKAQLLRVVADFYTLLTRGSNVAEEAIVECISSAIIILYVLGDKLGYSASKIDDEIKNSPWYKSVDCSIFIGKIINELSKNSSITPLLQGDPEIFKEVQKKLLKK